MKQLNTKKKSKHHDCKSRKQNEKYSILVKVYEFDNPDINEIFSVIDNCATGCYKRYFHSFTIKCIYDIEMTNGDHVNGIISDKKVEKTV